MVKQFVTYEIALKLKGLGFDEECFGVYYDYKGDPKLCFDSLFSNKDMIIHTNEHSYYALCLAPLWQQAIEWFLDVKDLHIEINNYNGGWMFRIYSFKGVDIYFEQTIGQIRNNSDKYEEVREQAILKAIELRM